MNFFDFILGRKRDFAAVAMDEVLACLQEKEYDRAIAVIKEKILSRDPGHRRALLHLGISHMLKGEEAEAREALLPLARESGMDSESATARIALDKMRKDGAGKGGGA